MTGLQNADPNEQIELVVKSMPAGSRSSGRLTTSRPKKRLKSSADSHNLSPQNDMQPINRSNGATTSGSSQTRRLVSRYTSIVSKNCWKQSQKAVPERTLIDSQGTSQVPQTPQESPKSSRHRVAPAKSIGDGSTRPTPSRVSTMRPQEIFGTRPLASTPLIAREPKLRGFLDEDFRPVHRTPGDTVIEISSTEETEERDGVKMAGSHRALPCKLLGKAARKTQVGPERAGSDDSDSSLGDDLEFITEESDDVERAQVFHGFDMPRRALGNKAARKSSTAMVQSDDSDSLSTTSTSNLGESECDTEDSEIQVIEPPVFTNTATKTLQTCSGLILTPSKIRTDEIPTLELVQALKGCVLRLPEGRLPFLRRNLRVGFEATCKAKRVETMPNMVTSGERLMVETVYLYPIDTLDERRYGSLTRELEAWTCPLCLLHLHFANRYMLQKHLEWDHVEVKTRWTKNRDEEKVTKWMIEINLPPPSKSGKDLSNIHPNFVFATYVCNPIISEPTRLATTHDLRRGLVDKGKAREMSVDPELELRIPFTQEPTGADSSGTTSRSSRGVPTPDFEFKQLKGRCASPSRLNFEDSSDPPDPLGPSAQFPFLPATSDDGKTVLNYSCRIGGPKIYDLLGLLSQEQFGTLSWVVLDREEEIFEVDDVKDEHKVMHALWARWIILHRMDFIRNYHDGVRMFINQYWKMIQVAAGWEALRYWLLVLLANRFLTGHEVAELLKHYQRKVGWDEHI